MTDNVESAMSSLYSYAVGSTDEVVQVLVFVLGGALAVLWIQLIIKGFKRVR